MLLAKTSKHSCVSLAEKQGAVALSMGNMPAASWGARHIAGFRVRSSSQSPLFPCRILFFSWEKRSEAGMFSLPSASRHQACKLAPIVPSLCQALLPENAPVEPKQRLLHTHWQRWRGQYLQEAKDSHWQASGFQAADNAESVLRWGRGRSEAHLRTDQAPGYYCT